MAPYLKFTMIASLGLGTTISYASSHWLLAWMGLEINTLAIIPLMTMNPHPRAMEAATKYFIIQATGAAVLLMTTSHNAWTTEQWEIHQLLSPTVCTTAMIALALKLGLAPMHFWMPEVMQGLNLMTGLILLTWQKLAPMILMYYLAPAVEKPMMMLMGILSALIGGWGGLNQTQLRKIMAYSSIAHMGWMMIVIEFMPKLMMLTLMVYMTTTAAVMLTLKIVTTTKINDLAMMWPKSPILTVMAMMAMLSLAGLPPLAGFMPKWLILAELTKQDMALTATVMVLTALLSLFFYLRLCYLMVLTIGPNTNNVKMMWRSKTKRKMMFLSITMNTTILFLPLAPLMLSFIK
uniref:NADH-ubiquinone oxidoreductase chain 2 n=1 Tax=Cyema atrum TaxID=556252 RepID=D1YUD9_9TELE|nr:NADH dehydrogenase subunit 2 [Cyema atrum]BAI53523.1 NADH dehydrogenase subunit 2 [Cyema atrum]